MSKDIIREIGLTEAEQFRALENLQEIHSYPSVNAINLNYYGEEQCENGYRFGPFVRTSYVLHMVRKGKGIFRKGKETYSIGSGQAFLIYPGEETIYQADEKEPWAYMWIGFHGLKAENMMEKSGFSRAHPVITCKNMEELVRIMEELLEYRELTYVNELLRTGCVYRLMGSLISNAENVPVENANGKNEKGSWDSLYVKKAVNLLVNSKDPHVKVEDVAHAIGISRGYLSSIFKKEMKQSPQEFLIRFRMERAADLLRYTDNPVGMIALEVGYTDSMSFSKSFRRHYGMTPSQYRKQSVELVRKQMKGDYFSRNPL